MVIKKKTSIPKVSTKVKTSSSKPKSKISSSKSKQKKVLKGKVIKSSIKITHPEKTYKIVFLAISIIFLIIGAVKLLSDNDKIAGIQFLITAVLFSKAHRKLSEKKISINPKDNRTKTFFIIGFVFSIVGISINIGVWAMGIILFSIWLFGK